MLDNVALETNKTLNSFLYQKDLNYKQSLSTISLFNQQITSTWNKQQKNKFASIFYHLRGHFINFAWYLANFSNSERAKKIILENIHEEIGIGNKFSHEKLYDRFAQECGVNIHDEIVHETNYLPFAKEFNKSHLQWLSEEGEEERISAFAAYERLDNIDYPYLVKLADSFNLSHQATAFFRVHTHVQHFDSTLELITPIWEKNPKQIEKAFNYIYNHQLNMWNNLSNHLIH